MKKIARQGWVKQDWTPGGQSLNTIFPYNISGAPGGMIWLPKDLWGPTSLALNLVAHIDSPWACITYAHSWLLSVHRLFLPGISSATLNSLSLTWASLQGSWPYYFFLSGRKLVCPYPYILHYCPKLYQEQDDKVRQLFKKYVQPHVPWLRQSLSARVSKHGMMLFPLCP